MAERQQIFLYISACHNVRDINPYPANVENMVSS